MATLPVAAVILAETLLASSGTAQKNGYRLNGRREIVTYAVGNVAAGLVGCCVVSGSVSRTAVNERNGGRTQLVSVMASVTMLVVLLVAALIGGCVWFFMNNHKNDENLTLAEKYMDRGDFDKALGYYEKAAEEAKDPTAINAAMQLIRDYQNAEDYVDSEQYTEAIAALKQLRDRVTDKDSTMYKSIEDLLSKAQSRTALLLPIWRRRRAIWRMTSWMRPPASSIRSSRTPR